MTSERTLVLINAFGSEFTERVDSHAERLREALERKAAKLREKDSPKPDEVIALRTQLIALSTTAISYGASESVVRRCADSLVDTTFGLSVDAIEYLLSDQPHENGEALLAIGAGGLDVLTRMLSRSEVQVPSVALRALPRGSPKSIERYIPLERCVANSEYRGFTAEALVATFDYSDKVAAGLQIRRIRSQYDDIRC